MRSIHLKVFLGPVLLACAPLQRVGGQDAIAVIRAEVERRYAKNAAAFIKRDVQGIMALRSPDFHTVGPDGRTNDRAAMERYTQGLLNGIKQWNVLEQMIDSLDVTGDTAIVTMTQPVHRMALRPDHLVHRVET